MEKIIDCRGMACPLPVVNAKKAAEELHGGDTLTVLVDNEIAVQNLQRFASHKGFGVQSEKKAEKEFAVVMTIGEEQPQGEEPSVACAMDTRKKGMLVVLSANVMGSGEEELGKALMKAFVFALTKQDTFPGTILLYNSGAYLSCEGSDSLEDLKFLEAQGTEIFTCGTCLNFYGMTEKLGVGNVTNMYDIVEALSKASHIIRP